MEVDQPTYRAGVALAPGNLVSLVVNAQVLNGIITPLLLTYVLVLANRRSVWGPP